MSQSDGKERCLVCRQPAPQRGPRGDGGSILCTLRGDTMELVGHLCKACKDRVDREAEADDLDEDGSI